MKKLMKLIGLNEESFTNLPRIQVGICARDKKARAAQMEQILNRLKAYGEFDIIFFGDECILNEPIENWPRCDYLLSWHSDGFPLEKAQAYIQMTKVPTINDLSYQNVIRDRRRMYKTLVSNQIPVPNHIIVERDNLPEGQDPEGFIEEEDFVELNGARIDKPFVEKPADADDHNIWIYYPASMGGGVKRLFRKVENQSSAYDASHPGAVRRDGSYIIEEFLPTGGTDVKVYTVGPRYAHAEARKSPVVDGKVVRTAEGKEMRFPVLLSPYEKDIARMIVNIFRQKICGFDLLRSDKGKVYVCDVNGWSFVKNSKRYADDAAGILRSIILGVVAPKRLAARPNPELPEGHVPSLRSGLDDDDALPGATDEEDEGSHPNMDPKEVQHTDERSKTEELRCVLAVIRHGDRTPKQKLKIKLSAQPILTMFNKYKDSKGKQAKLKTPIQLQELLDCTRDLLASMEVENVAVGDSGDLSSEKDANAELREKLRIVKTVLEQAAFNGVNRKVQLKPSKYRDVPSSPYHRRSMVSNDGEGMNYILPVTSSKDFSSLATTTDQQQAMVNRSSSMHRSLHPFGGQASDPPSGSEAGGQPYDALMGSLPRPQPTSITGGGDVEEVEMILKWGGVLTHAGRQQAEDLGRVFRMVMYPRYGSAGGGLLRLHSTYRHDLKIYSSDEGRVQVSAAAFTKGLLDLEGNSLTPILVSLVNKDASMLEAFGKGASDDISDAKALMYSALTHDPDAAPPQTLSKGSPEGLDHSESAFADAFTNEAIHKSIQQEDPASRVFEDGAAAASEARKHLRGFPSHPVSLLNELLESTKSLVTHLRALCVRSGPHSANNVRYSSLSMEPAECKIDPDNPCGGEKMLLMFDRWNKLLKSFYSEKKGFDISKIPDLYDSAKFDAIHNRHLMEYSEGASECLKELFSAAKKLASAVIPSEYGVSPSNKLTIGSKICGELLGKLLCDMRSMRDESKAVAAAGSQSVTPNQSKHCLCDVAEEKHGDEEEADSPAVHRLAADFAPEINSPLRHVRTRIYFTSESHIHSLVNVLRYGHLHPDHEMREGPHLSALLREEGLEMLQNQHELDYLTQIIFRLYENKSLPFESPHRFRVEILFTPGANYSPLEVDVSEDHVVPIIPRNMIHEEERDGGITLSDIESVWSPIAKTNKFAGGASSQHQSLLGQDSRLPLAKENQKPPPSRLGRGQNSNSSAGVLELKKSGGGQEPTSP